MRLLDRDVTYYRTLDHSSLRWLEVALQPIEMPLRRLKCVLRGHTFGDPRFTWKTYCSRCGRASV